MLFICLGAIGKSGRWRAKQVVCQLNESKLTVAWNKYAEDNDDWIVVGHTGDFSIEGEILKPWAYFPDRSSPGLEPKFDSIRAGALYPYLEKVEIYHCPSDDRYLRPAPYTNDYPDVYGGYRSYSIPGGLLGVNPTGGWGIIPYQKFSLSHLQIQVKESLKG